MQSGLHWHVMVGDHPSIPNHNIEYRDPEEAAGVFIDLTYALMSEQYKHVPRFSAKEDLMHFMQNNIDENVASQAGSLKIVLTACSGCFNQCLN